MRPIQFNFTYSVIALVILGLVWIHKTSQGKLDDYSSQVFRKLILLGMLDILLDIISVVVPAMEFLSQPVLYTAINAVYYQVNVYLCFMILYYTISLRESSNKMTARMQHLTQIPGIISFLLLLINFPTGLVFFYDANGTLCSGSLYKFLYAIAALYLLLSVMVVLRYQKEYGNQRKKFIFRTFAIIGVCCAIQLIFSTELVIDLGIALATLSFYLYYNNPVLHMDFLTGALDKNYFDTWIQEQIRAEKCIYLIIVHVENMQYINDAGGEAISKKVLSELAQTLRNYDDEKMVFRLSENCLMVHCHNRAKYADEEAKLEQWLQKAENQTYKESGCVVHLFGIPNAEQFIPEYSINTYIDYLLHHTEKEDSSILTESCQATIAGFRYDMEIERYLKEALENDYFTLAYQPIYHLKEQRYISAEALMRLHHPVFGTLNTQYVIDLAEKCGIINELTRVLFTRLCTFMKAEPEIVQKLDRFKFNISPLSLRSPSFLQDLVQIIHQFELPSDKFEFEFTESFATDTGSELEGNIQICLENHIHLSLDDFGKGYSNLSNVLQIPFSNIKLDRSLLLKVRQDEATAKFYEGVMHLMQNYGLKIICEGVETEEENELLSVWGADMIQGYYYSKPLDGESLKKFLLSEP